MLLVISEPTRFPIFIGTTLAEFVGILRVVMRKRAAMPSWRTVAVVSVIVVVGGMLFAKLTQNGGWPWWIYYTVPAAVTLCYRRWHSDSPRWNSGSTFFLRFVLRRSFTLLFRSFLDGTTIGRSFASLTGASSSGSIREPWVSPVIVVFRGGSRALERQADGRVVFPAGAVFDVALEHRCALPTPMSFDAPVRFVRASGGRGEAPA